MGSGDDRTRFPDGKSPRDAYPISHMKSIRHTIASTSRGARRVEAGEVKKEKRRAASVKRKSVPRGAGSPRTVRGYRGRRLTRSWMRISTLGVAERISRGGGAGNLSLLLSVADPSARAPVGGEGCRASRPCALVDAAAARTRDARSSRRWRWRARARRAPRPRRTRRWGFRTPPRPSGDPATPFVRSLDPRYLASFALACARRRASSRTRGSRRSPPPRSRRTAAPPRCDAATPPDPPRDTRTRLQPTTHPPLAPHRTRRRRATSPPCAPR